MTVIERTPGHDLYREWIDAPGTDAAEKEWHPQNPAVKERWEKLAARVTADRGAVEALIALVDASADVTQIRNGGAAERWHEAMTRARDLVGGRSATSALGDDFEKLLAWHHRNAAHGIASVKDCAACRALLRFLEIERGR